MNFGYLYIRSPNGKTPWKKSPPGGETPCLWRTEKPQNCTPKMPNVTSETHRKWCFWFLFPLAAAMNFGYLFLLLLQRLLLLLLVPGWENTMAVKDGEAPKLHHVTSETTAEAFATAAAGPRMEKHHGKNHLPAGKHHPSSPKTP